MANAILRAGTGIGFLVLGTSSEYTLSGNDKGSSAKKDCTLFRPKPAYFHITKTDPERKYGIVGDYLQQGYTKIATGSSDTICPQQDDPENDVPAAMEPQSWVKVWTKKLKNKSETLTFWQPIPYPNYRALGWVATFTVGGAPSQPDVPDYLCVYSTFTVEAEIGPALWNDHGAGNSAGTPDYTFYAVKGLPNAFIGQPGHDKPFVGTAYKLKPR
jgi:hypothetical protein